MTVYNAGGATITMSIKRNIFATSKDAAFDQK